MLDLDELRRAEVGFCAGFTHCEERPYGLLYHNVDNPFSHDSNHAVVLDRQADPEALVGDIVAFYEERDLVPRLYCAMYRGELDRLRPALAASGFSVLAGPDPMSRWFVWQGTPREPAGSALAVRRVRDVDGDLVRLIDSDGECPWTTGVLQRHVLVDDFHLLVGYLGDRPVTVASFKVMDGLSRVDDVFTDTAYRGRGYARVLMSELAARHRQVSDNTLYLGANDPTAIRVYQDVGFAEQYPEFDSWTAWKAGGT